jgi:small subunit ribosomal protein S17
MKKGSVKEGHNKSQKECTDSKCPIHGTVKLRGKKVTGIVLKVNPQRTAIVGWDRTVYVQKYERYEKRRTKITVHNPPCIDAQEGDTVVINETRPISKTKHFAIIKKVGSDYLFKEKQERLEEGKHKVKKEELDEKDVQNKKQEKVKEEVEKVEESKTEEPVEGEEQ